MMKFVIDDKIPYIQGVLEAFGEVIYVPGAKTTAEVIKDADVLITRTRTRCNKVLLEGSSVKLIATATIGYDHIDTKFCKEAGIEWTNAPGCNSKSVEQYILSSLLVLAQRHSFTLKDKTIGIVGVGQVGSKVAKACKILGMNVLLNDPPRERNEGSGPFVSLETIKQESDFISLHVPLNTQGEDATFHLADTLFFHGLGKRPYLINSCRGEVIDSFAVESALQMRMISGLILDCWKNEPNIDLGLLDKCELATPHIAGYSKDGKANGTSMSIQAISRFFNLGIDNWQAQNVEPPPHATIEIDGKDLSEEAIISKAVLSTYNILNDDQTLRSNPSGFEKQRGDYPVRREYPAYTITAKNIENEILIKLKELGFNME